MAKKSGLAQLFFVGGYDLSGDVGAIGSCASPRTTLEVTGLNKSAMERVNGLADGNLEFNTWFNDASEQEHDALSGLPTTNRVTLYATGGAIGDPAAGLAGKQINYDWSRGNDGSLQGTVQVQGASGAPLEWMELLTAGIDTFASAGAAASKDDGAGTSNGLAAIIQIVDIDSGTPTMVIEDSPNDSTWATLVSFSAVASGSEPAAQRVTVSGNVDRYLRLNPTGTFSNLDCAVAYRRGTAQDDEAY